MDLVESCRIPRTSTSVEITASVISSVSQVQLPSVVWKELYEKGTTKLSSVLFYNLQWVEEHEA